MLSLLFRITRRADLCLRDQHLFQKPNFDWSRPLYSKLGGLFSWKFLIWFGLAFTLGWTPIAFADQTIPVRVDRWLEVQQFTGTVNLRRGSSSSNARVGDRLQFVGDRISTGANSSTSLAVDTGIGFVNVSASTNVEIQTLETVASGGKITKLKVTGGQIRVQLRPFASPDSKFEIETPAGTGGVRGTTFGVSVQPDGVTGIATLEGGVVASAQGQSVRVTAGTQSLVVPGEPPTPAEPLRDDPSLDIVELVRSRQEVTIVGQTDAVNLLKLGDKLQILDREGRFKIQVAIADLAEDGDSQRDGRTERHPRIASPSSRLWEQNKPMN